MKHDLYFKFSTKHQEWRLVDYSGLKCNTPALCKDGIAEWLRWPAQEVVDTMPEFRLVVTDVRPKGKGWHFAEHDGYGDYVLDDDYFTTYLSSNFRNHLHALFNRDYDVDYWFYVDYEVK